MRFRMGELSTYRDGARLRFHAFFPGVSDRLWRLASGECLLDLAIDVLAVDRLMLLDWLAAACVLQNPALPDDLGRTFRMGDDSNAGATQCSPLVGNLI